MFDGDEASGIQDTGAGKELAGVCAPSNPGCEDTLVAPDGPDDDGSGTSISPVCAPGHAHHMHAWSLTSGRTIFSAHVLRSDEAEPDLLDRITRMLKEKYGFYFSTVQIESSYEGEEGAEEIEFLRHEKFSP